MPISLDAFRGAFQGVKESKLEKTTLAVVGENKTEVGRTSGKPLSLSGLQVLENGDSRIMDNIYMRGQLLTSIRDTLMTLNANGSRGGLENGRAREFFEAAEKRLFGELVEAGGKKQFGVETASADLSAKTVKDLISDLDKFMFVEKMLQGYDAKIGKPQFGPLSAMFKDVSSRIIALRVLGLLDASWDKFGEKETEANCFLSMLADAVAMLQKDGLDKPLSRERLCEAFSIPPPANLNKLNVHDFTEKFLTGLSERMMNDGMRYKSFTIVNMVTLGMRYGSALEMFENPDRGVRRRDFFVMPNPIRLTQKDLNDPAEYLKARVYAVGRDLNATPNVCFTFNGKVIYSVDSKKNWTVPSEQKDVSDEQVPTEAKKSRSAACIAKRVRELCSKIGISDLLLAQVLTMPTQAIGIGLMSVLSPKLTSQDMNVDCTMMKNGEVKVKITPRANEEGRLPPIKFNVELTIGLNGQIRMDSMQSGKGEPILLKDWSEKG